MQNTDLQDEPKIAMLLDTEHLYGEHEGRLAPVLTTLLVAAIPILLYMYFGIFEIIPVWLFAPIEVIVIVRAIMIIPGREGYRLENYRKRMDDKYTSSAALMNIGTVYENGLVEYINGKVWFAVKCYNGTCEDSLERTKLLRKFIVSLVGDFDFDTYILNDGSTGLLRRYYSKIKRFGKNTASMNFTKIIDWLCKLTRNKSMVQCTVIVIRGTKSDWKQMKIQIDGAIHSQMSKAFKTVKLISNRNELAELIDMDMDTNVNISDLLRAKHMTGEYYNSKVIAYDPTEEVVIGVAETKEDKSRVSDAPAPKSSFHVAYKEESKSPVMVKAEPKPEYYQPIVLNDTKPKSDDLPPNKVRGTGVASKPKKAKVDSKTGKRGLFSKRHKKASSV